MCLSVAVEVSGGKDFAARWPPLTMHGLPVLETKPGQISGDPLSEFEPLARHAQPRRSGTASFDAIVTCECDVHESGSYHGPR